MVLGTEKEQVWAGLTTVQLGGTEGATVGLGAVGLSVGPVVGLPVVGLAVGAVVVGPTPVGAGVLGAILEASSTKRSSRLFSSSRDHEYVTASSMTWLEEDLFLSSLLPPVVAAP